MPFCPKCQTAIADDTVACSRCGYSENGAPPVDPVKKAAKEQELRAAGLGGELVDLEGDSGTSPAVWVAGLVVLLLVAWMFF